MERHRCKLCFKSFVNGRALGGHMRSHMFNLPVVPKPEGPKIAPSDHVYEEADSASSSSSEEGEGDELQGCGPRENPKRNIRLVDPEFNFPAVDVASVVLQDRESETESSKNTTRRRSKRFRIKPEHHHEHDQRQEPEKAKKFLRLDNINNNQASKTESWPEAEPASSISNATTEEDVAFCLMLLSKDRWKKKAEKDLEELEETDKYFVDEAEDNSEEDLKQSQNRSSLGKYKCETCNKVFKSYQALGGHRASHKKIRVDPPSKPAKSDPGNAGTSYKKTHECPVCYRVFSSGQALGGHKRSHVIAGTVEASVPRSSKKLGDSSSLIDLNLPAPAEEDEFSQIELSAVSDAEFVNQAKR